MFLVDDFLGSKITRQKTEKPRKEQKNEEQEETNIVSHKKNKSKGEEQKEKIDWRTKMLIFFLQQKI